MSRISAKYNDSCIKIFELLKLLYKNEATYENVKKLLAVNYDEKLTTPVLINKYLNTLKVFGVNVEKAGNKYVMLNSPYKIDFDKIDLQSILILENAIEVIPNSHVSDELKIFIENLDLRFNDKAKSYINSLNSKKYQNLSDYYKQYEKEISLCETYIKEAQKLSINSKNKQKICLNIKLARTGFIKSIPIDEIAKITQFPSKTGYINGVTTVVFKLTGRLAKNYRLRNCEKVQDIDSDGAIVVVNKGEDIDSLISRLIRYQDSCRIISPKILKEKFMDTISKMLENYED